MGAEGANKNQSMNFSEKDIHILIADFDILSHVTFKKSIDVGRYPIESAFTIKEVRKKLGLRKYHLLIIGDQLPDGSGIEQIEPILEDHPYLQIWCLAAKKNLKAAQVLKDKVYRITCKPIRWDDIFGVMKLLRNFVSRYSLVDREEDVNKDLFGRVFLTLEDAAIHQAKSRKPKFIVKQWCLADEDDGCYITYYQEVIKDFLI